MYKLDTGQVVIVYHQPIPKLVKVEGNTVYFEPKHGVSLAMVDEGIVPKLLAYRGGCCGGQKQVMLLANEAQYKHWVSGNGGR